MKQEIKILPIVLMLLIATHSIAQEFESDFYSNQVQAPSEANSFKQYGNYSVNHYLGQPNVNLPIYTIKSRKLSIPISISYDASGVKLDEIAGMVGLKWSLQAGGSISRDMRGLPDELPGDGYFATSTATSGDWSDETIIDWVKLHEKKDKDTEPDEFIININGQNIRFVFNQNSVPYTIPRRAIKIIPYYQNNKIYGFDVTLEDGVKYTYGKEDVAIESTQLTSLNINYVPEYNFIHLVHETMSDPQSYISCGEPHTSDNIHLVMNEDDHKIETITDDFYNNKWHLTKITDSNTSDFIDLDYESGNQVKYVQRPSMIKASPIKVKERLTFSSIQNPDFTYPHQTFWYTDPVLGYVRNLDVYLISKFNPSDPGSATATLDADEYFDIDELVGSVGSGTINQTEVKTNQKLLKLITTSAGYTVVFSNSTVRTDLEGGGRLDYISVFNGQGQKVKQYGFDYETVTSNNLDKTDSKNPFSVLEKNAIDRIVNKKVHSGTDLTAEIGIEYSPLDFPADCDWCEDFAYEGLKEYNYKRLFLKGLTEYGNSSRENVIYTFDYTEAEKLKRRTSLMVDKYGYMRTSYTAEKSPFSATQNYVLSNSIDPMDNMDTPGEPLYGMLNTVHFESGGLNEFIYSKHQGYPRLDQINSKTSIGTGVQSRIFSYQTSIVNSEKEPIFETFQNYKIEGTSDWIKYKITSSYPQNSVNGSNGKVTTYSKVREYNSEDMSQGYIEYAFSHPRYNGTFDAREYNTNIESTIDSDDENIFPFPRRRKKQYLHGLLLSKKTVDDAGLVLSQINNEYVLNPVGYTPVDIQYFLGGRFVYSSSMSTTWYGKQSSDPVYNYRYSFPIHRQDWIVLDNTSSTVYDQDFPENSSRKITSVTEYKYDLTYLQLIETKKYNTGNNFISTVKNKYITDEDYKYGTLIANRRNACLTKCGNLYTPGTPAAEQCEDDCYSNNYLENTYAETLQTMLDKGITNRVLESTSWIEDTRIGIEKVSSSTTTLFDEEGRPKTMWVYSGTGTSFTESTLDANLGFDKDDDYEQERAFNFYDLYSNLTRTTLKDGTINTFEYGYNSSLLTASTINPGANEQRTTYVHTPLVGVTEITNPNGEKSTYEYDDFNRLSMIKDDDDNIIQRYRYNNKTNPDGLNADFNYSGPFVNGTVSFLGSTHDALQGQTTYLWDYGDGTTEEIVDWYTTSHTYQNAGTYTAKLIVINPDYETVEHSEIIQIN